MAREEEADCTSLTSPEPRGLQQQQQQQQQMLQHTTTTIESVQVNCPVGGFLDPGSGRKHHAIRARDCSDMDDDPYWQTELDRVLQGVRAFKLPASTWRSGVLHFNILEFADF